MPKSPTPNTEVATPAQAFTCLRVEGEIWRRLERLLLPVSFSAALLFVAIGIERSLWLDEANSVLIAVRGFSGIVTALQRENNLPAYYLALAGWTHLFGISEIALRALSGLFYLAGGVAVYLFARSLFGDKRTSTYAAFLFLISTQAIRQAQNVRMYTLLGLLSAVSTALLFDLRSGGKRWKWLAYALVCSAGTFTHMWFFFVLAAHATLVVRTPRPMRWRLLAVCGSAVLPFCVFWLPSSLGQLQNGATSWMPKFEFWFIASVFQEYYGGFPLGLLFYAVSAVLIGAGLLRRSVPLNDSTADLMWIAAVSIGAPLAVTVVKPIYWPGRYTIIALPFVAVLLARAFVRLSPRPLLVMFCCGWMLVTFGRHVAARDSVPERDGSDGHSDKRTSQHLLNNANAGDILVFTSLSRAGIDYYIQRSGAGARFREFSFPAEIATHLGWRNPQAMLRDRPGLEGQSERICSSAESALARDHARLWLLWGWDSDISDILKRKLDARFAAKELLDLKGSFYDKVTVYSSREPTGAGSSRHQ